MKQIIAIAGIVFTMLPAIAYSQEKLPVIHSNTKSITIQFNDQRIAWYLQPEIKPDVFTVGSTFRKKQVRFITGIDSVTYNIEAGQHYDFIILLNNKEACYTRIAAISDPLLINKMVGIPALLALMLLLVLGWRKRASLNIRSLLIFGMLTPLLFWTMTIIGGFMHGNYNHAKMTVSELGTIGTKSEFFMSICTMLLALLSLCFSIGFYKACKKLGLNTIPAILSVAMPVSFAWAAVFPSGHELHGLLGPLPAFLIAGALLAAVVWEKENAYAGIRIFSLVSFLLMLLFALRFIPAFQQEFPGLVQRFLYAGWSVWCISLNRSLKNNLTLRTLNSVTA